MLDESLGAVFICKIRYMQAAYTPPRSGKIEVSDLYTLKTIPQTEEERRLYDPNDKE